MCVVEDKELNRKFQDFIHFYYLPFTSRGYIGNTVLILGTLF